ncbi:DMT family transporter [Nisaea sp.]|uniref:DMT family transporter n=1 Tax=Nisaea sp. TaxID=2024842 RepID=UPI003296B580
MTLSSIPVLKGLFWATTAILVWSGSLVMLRLGVTTSLNVYDLTALRFGIAAFVLLPVLLRHGFGLRTLGISGFLTMVGGFGAPYIIMMSTALQTATASAGGALNPGVMAIASVVLGGIVFRDSIGGIRIGGIGLILGGGALIIAVAGPATVGHLILIGTGLMWCAYAMTVRWKAIPALQATAYVAVWSALLYLPVYLLFLPKQIGTAPLPDMLIQAAFQGVLVSILAIFAFNRSAELLGPIAGATLPALIPLASLLLGALFLDEAAGMAEIFPAVLIGAGVAMILAGNMFQQSVPAPAPRRLSAVFSSENRIAPESSAAPK